MIIVSQNRNEIINFEKITEIVASGNTISITDNIYEEIGEIIGEYATEERAKEVLQEIIKSINDSDVKIYSGRASLDITSQIKTIYYMPEK